ncbi:MAG: enolase C-terminal domain-like protein [Actinomycetota bacterium]
MTGSRGDRIRVEIGTFPMPFRIVFRHTTAARDATENVVVRLTDDDGNAGHGEGCPRSYVTGETSATAIDYLREVAEAVTDAATTVDELRAWVGANRADIDSNPAAFCALELALLDLFGRRSGRTVEQLLGIDEPVGPFDYSAVLGDGGAATFAAQLLRYRLGGLRHYKLKLSGDLDRDRTKMRWFRGRFGRFIASSVRVDANNRWSDPTDAIEHLRALDIRLLGIEEPLAANDHRGFLAIAEAVDTRIILDESLLRSGQVADLPGDPDRWILNCRISKSGGLLRSLELVEAATAAGLGVIVGAHVGETSLLTRAALTAATAAGPALLAQEGAFGTNLLSQDITDTPIMFGRGGRLEPGDAPEIQRPGLGVEVVADRLVEAATA